MSIFRKHERDDVVTRDDDDDVTRDEPVARDRVVADRRGDWGGPPLVRALFTLLGIGAAGLLIWLASYFELTSTSEFWAAMGLIAAAGLALGLSQLFGGWTKWGIPMLSPGVFLLAFIPAAVVVGWVLLATQPDGGWQQERLAGWTSDLGITGLVNDLGTFPAALAMGLGIVFAFSFDTTGPRRHEVIDREREVVADEDVHDYDRGVGKTTPVGESTTVRDRETVAAGDASGDRVDIRDPNRRETTEGRSREPSRGGAHRAPLSHSSLAPGIDSGPVRVDEEDMAAAGRNRSGDDRGAPRLLEHCAAYERMLGAEGCSARARLDTLLGGELASLLCRALMSTPRPASIFAL